MQGQGVSERPRRVTKKPQSDDFIDNIDIEIEAIESMPAPLPKPVPAAPHEGGPRKRGRPRKYPLAPPPPQDVEPVKRPRGRPKGSGKHQRGFLGSGPGYGAASNGGVPTESGVTSVAVSTAPSITLPGPPTARVHDTRKHAAATPDFSFTAEIPPTAHENGHGTPHFPPRGGRAGSEDSGDDSPSSRVRTNHEMNGETGAAAATEDAHMVAGSTRSGRVLRGAAAAAATRAARQASEEEEEDADDEYTEDRAGGRDAATPTPRPRNRRKGAAPTKTE